jgi:hypothetical protein
MKIISKKHFLSMTVTSTCPVMGHCWGYHMLRKALATENQTLKLKPADSL